MVKLISTNPAKNYQVFGSVTLSTAKETTQKVAKARAATSGWKDLGVAKRIAILRPLYDEFLKRIEEIALLVTREIGKPIAESRSDLEWDKDYFLDFLNNGSTYLEDEVLFREGKKIHKLVYEPLGVAAVIVPWNYPFANFLWGVIPNIIAGNTVVFKHSEECPLVGRLIEEMMQSLGLPYGVFSQVYGDGRVGELLVNGDLTSSGLPEVQQWGDGSTKLPARSLSRALWRWEVQIPPLFLRM